MRYGFAASIGSLALGAALAASPVAAQQGLTPEEQCIAEDLLLRRSVGQPRSGLMQAVEFGPGDADGDGCLDARLLGSDDSYKLPFAGKGSIGIITNPSDSLSSPIDTRRISLVNVNDDILNIYLLDRAELERGQRRNSSFVTLHFADPNATKGERFKDAMLFYFHAGRAALLPPGQAAPVIPGLRAAPVIETPRRNIPVALAAGYEGMWMCECQPEGDALWGFDGFRLEGSYEGFPRVGASFVQSLRGGAHAVAPAGEVECDDFSYRRLGYTFEMPLADGLGFAFDASHESYSASHEGRDLIDRKVGRSFVGLGVVDREGAFHFAWHGGLAHRTLRQDDHYSSEDRSGFGPGFRLEGSTATPLPANLRVFLKGTGAQYLGDSQGAFYEGVAGVRADAGPLNLSVSGGGRHEREAGLRDGSGLLGRVEATVRF